MSNTSDIIPRTQAVVLKSISQPLGSIQQITGFTAEYIDYLYDTAIQRGWRPGTPVEAIHVQDEIGSGKVTGKLDEA